MLHWAGCAIALVAGAFGLYCVGYSLVLMSAHRPTGASLTLAMGVVSYAAGAMVYYLGRGLRYVFSRE